MTADYICINYDTNGFLIYYMSFKIKYIYVFIKVKLQRIIPLK